MANMRDKLIKLVGKKVAIDSGVGYLCIKPLVSNPIWYDEIIEIGDDYFVVKKVFKDEYLQHRNCKTTYAISGVSSIEGGL
ncbi:MAG: hypothetical protein WAV16_01960 [Candidatus Moraniibacteriota bacterium]